MNHKKSIKIVFIVILVMILLINYTPFTYATSSNIIGGADNFIQDTDTTLPIDDSKMQEISGNIYNTLLILGIVIAAIVGVVLGIQFMTGSVSQKSKVKEALIPYFAGCIVVFGAFGIWKLVVTILGQLN